MSLSNRRYPLSLSLLLLASGFAGSVQAQFQFAPATELSLPASLVISNPALSSDGLTLYLTWEASGGQGLRDIWTATRQTRFGQFGPFINLGPNLNSSSRDGGSSISSDDLSMFFHSDRPGG
jgi:hypothetical protein